MKERVIQFGEGNFLRGFVDYFLFKMTQKGLFEGKVTVVQPIAQGKVGLLNEQAGKYNLYLRGLEKGLLKTEHSLIDVISRGLNPYEDFEAFLQLAENKDYRFIISNTTEAGIAFDDTCSFDDRPAASFPGKLTQLLYRRFEKGLPGFIILPCELIDNNADELKKHTLAYAQKWRLGQAFENWLESENIFANTLVDRIVTGYPEDEAMSLNPEDKLLNTAELFHLWVIEGNFEDELPLQKAGFNVVWADDVGPYKKRKVRILNGCHTAMVPAAISAGLETVKESMEDKDVSSFLQHCLYEEILPAIGNSNEDRQFAADVLERFRNPFIKHQLRAIALNSVSKFAVRVLPSLLDYKNMYGDNPKGLTMALAFLINFYKNEKPQDLPQIIDFMKGAERAQILSSKDIWGCDLSFLLQDVESCLELIDKKGVREAMQWAIS
ncbi:MAG: tagaturonate reductase [Clostridiales bacterium]|nr:tagaturonate reductase [Clostridiales bacterium]